CEQGVVGEETGERGEVGPAKDLDVRAAARPGAGNDVGLAVPVHVPGGDEHAAGQLGIVREETEEFAGVHGGAELDVRTGAAARPWRMCGYQRLGRTAGSGTAEGCA